MRRAGPVAATWLVLVLAAGCGSGPPPREPAAVAVPGVPGPAAPQAAPATPQAAPLTPAAGAGDAGPCTADTLDVSATPVRTEGDTGTQELVFRNTGADPCLLSGYPGVTFVAGNAGTPVGPRAAVTGPRRSVVLSPGGAATAPLRITDADALPAADCAAEDVRGIRVAPPGGTGGAFVPRPGRACAGALDEPQALVGSVTAR